MSKVEEKREAFVERVTTALEAGTVPWCSSELPCAPQQKADTGKAYSGLNAFYLLSAAGESGYSDPRWLTSKEIQSHGLKIRAGEKSVSLEFWDKDEDGRMDIPAYRDKGTFTAAPELDVVATKEYAKEQAEKHLEGSGNVFWARGENASYKGEIVELTPNFAFQKVNENVILHRLKDLASNENSSLVKEGQNLDISKDTKGGVTIKAYGKEHEEQQRENRQSREGVSR